MRVSCKRSVRPNPGEAVLIPYMLYDSSKGINTLTGITIPSTLGTDPSQIEIGGAANGAVGFTTAGDEAAGDCSLTGAPNNTSETGVISWWFFDDVGNLQHKGTLFTGCDDFVALDWGSVVNSSGIPSLNGKLGYLVLANNVATSGREPAGLRHVRRYDGDPRQLAIGRLHSHLADDGQCWKCGTFAGH